MLSSVKPNPLRERQMSKRKPETSSKHTHRPKLAKAQRVSEAVVRSPKPTREHSIATGLSETPFERLEDSKQDAPLAENPLTALQDDRLRTMTHNLNKGFDLSGAMANLRAYQAKLLEIGQANMQFGFEFTQRIAAIRSPLDFPSVVAEFTSRRISLFQKYSKEIVELGTRRSV
jgi:hypothetical protein